MVPTCLCIVVHVAYVNEECSEVVELWSGHNLLTWASGSDCWCPTFQARQCSDCLMEKLTAHNRRTLDLLSARCDNHHIPVFVLQRRVLLQSHAHTHTRTHMHAHTDTCTHTHARTHMHACTHTYMHTHTHARTHTHTHTCTHTHTRTHTHMHYSYVQHHKEGWNSVKRGEVGITCITTM